MRLVYHRKRWLLSLALLVLLLAGMLWWQATQARAWHDVGPIDPTWATTPHAVAVNGESIFFAIVDGNVVAFNRRDTHPKGCIVNWEGWLPHRFNDPCLGTMYKMDGTYVSGPSPRSLDRFAVHVTNNQVAVNTSIIMRGAPLNSPTLWEQIQSWFASLW